MTKEQIQALQDKYNRWCTLKPELEKTFTIWQEVGKLSHELDKFYTSADWLDLHDSFNEPLDTQGNFSILSEDALWNDLIEQRQQTMKLLKLAVQLLEQGEN